nr:GtrA family protein [Mobiluncus porci]
MTVGGANYLVDLAVFNLFLLVIAPQWPLFDKCVAVAVATTFSWIANRSWTFRGRGGHGVFKEAALFILVNVIGALPPLACLWVSHYLMGFTSPLADNISANVIGLVLGTALRYVLYKLVVFPSRKV